MENISESLQYKPMNENNNMIVELSFSVGDVVIHTKYQFRAVVIDVVYDVKQSADYSKIKTALDYSEELEQQIWYKLLIDDGEDLNFVPEIMLNSDLSSNPVRHPLLSKYLKTNEEKGIYTIGKSVH